MELIFGGAYQGKTHYAAQKYDFKEDEIFTCEGTLLSKTARCICHLERFAKACCEEDLDPCEEFKRQAPGAICFLADDISCGIVPLDPAERKWRERSGRLVSYLAAQADIVTRVFCGLPLEVKP